MVFSPLLYIHKLGKIKINKQHPSYHVIEYLNWKKFIKSKHSKDFKRGSFNHSWPMAWPNGPIQVGPIIAWPRWASLPVFPCHHPHQHTCINSCITSTIHISTIKINWTGIEFFSHRCKTYNTYRLFSPVAEKQNPY